MVWQLPRFASDDTVADITEPPDSLKDAGWVGGATPDRPAAQHFNWLFRQGYEVFKILRDTVFYLMADNFTARNSDARVTGSDAVTFHAVSRFPGVANTTFAVEADAVVYSTDGSSWQKVLDVGFASVLRGAGSNFSQAVVVGSAGKVYVSPSTSPATWVDRSGLFPTASTLQGVLWDPVHSLFVAWGSGGSPGIWTTPDPDTVAWTNRFSVEAIERVAINPYTGKLLAVPLGMDTIYESTDAVTWAASGASFSAASGPLGELKFARVEEVSVWVAAGSGTQAGETAQPSIWYSTDEGATWSIMSPNIDGSPFAKGDGTPMYAECLEYSPDVNHWLVGFRNGTDLRLYAFQVGDPGSVSQRTFLPAGAATPTAFGFVFWANALGVTGRAGAYWLLGLSTRSDEAIYQSDSPLL